MNQLELLKKKKRDEWETPESCAKPLRGIWRADERVLQGKRLRH